MNVLRRSRCPHLSIARPHRGIFALAIVSIVVGVPSAIDDRHVALAAEEPHVAEGAAQKPSQGDLARMQRKSEQAFLTIQDSMAANPKDRDYRTALAQITELCEKYPGSGAAYRAIFAVEQWQKSEFVPQTAAAPILAFRQKFNPAADEIRKLNERFHNSSDKGDMEAIREVVTGLQQIAVAHPGSESEFLALAALGPAYDRLGDHQKALDAADSFLKKYPHDSTDYSNVDTYISTNLTLRARLLSRTRSLKEGIEAFQESESQFHGRPQGLGMLYEAGRLALRNRQPREAIRIFEDIVSRYDASSDERVIISRFKIVEALVQLKENERGLELAKQLLADYGDNKHWRREAEAAIRYFQSPDGDTAPIAPVPEPGLEVPPSGASSSEHSSRSILIAINAIVFVCLAAAVAFRRLRRGRKSSF